MKSLTKKQIVVVNKEIRKAALKMRNNSNNPYEVIGFYTSKIENLTNLIDQGYCKGNSIPDDDIKNFVKRWANKYKLKLECWGENYVRHIQ